MKLGHTILYVDNVHETLDFYSRAFGFKINPMDVSEGDYGELDTGETSLGFCSYQLLRSMNKNPQMPNAHAPCFEIAFTTEDVPTALENAIKEGAILIQNAEQMPWGQTIAYVSDPNGFLIELCTPINFA